MTIGIDPVAFTIGSVSVRWYGIMVALAVLAIVLWMLWQVKKGAKLSNDTIFMAAIIGIPSGIIVSRLLHVIDNIVVAKLHPELALTGGVIDYLQHPELIVGASGLTIYGAVLGGALGIWVYSRFSNFRFGYFTDLIVPGIILAQIIGRIGCTINGCCYGAETSLACGIVYSHPDTFGPQFATVHPTQIYEIIFLLVLFVLILAFRERFRPDGSIFLIYLAFYSLWRIGIDFLREGMPFLFTLHQAQVIGIIVLAITIPLLVMRTRWVGIEEQSSTGE